MSLSFNYAVSSQAAEVMKRAIQSHAKLPCQQTTHPLLLLSFSATTVDGFSFFLFGVVITAVGRDRLVSLDLDLVSQLDVPHGPSLLPFPFFSFFYIFFQSLSFHTNAAQLSLLNF